MAIHDVLRELSASDSFLVTIHIHPDGDAIGSLLGMVTLLDDLGKRVVPVSHDPVPERFQFLEGWEQICSVQEAADRGPYDAMIILDAGELHRIGDVRTLLTDEMVLLNVDHHDSNDLGANAAFVNSNASATAEMMVEIYRELGVSISQSAATSLYTGIMTDTGRFRFSNVTRQTFEAAAELVKAGANPATISSAFFASSKEEELRTLSRVLDRMQLHSDGRFVLSYLTKAEEDVETDGFIDTLMSLKSVEVGVLLRPLENGLFKASYRSSGDVNVAEVARQFGGGGHIKASGSEIKGDLETALNTVRDACCNAIEALDAAE